MRNCRGLLTLLPLFIAGQALAADMSSPVCTSSADTQKLGCVCVFSEKASPVAMLSDVKGVVLKSDAGGFSEVSKPTPLGIDDIVQTKTDGSALLTAGINCHRAIGPNVSLAVRDLGQGCGCAAVLGESSTAAVDPGLLIAGGAIGVGVLLLSQPVSPPP